jgi:PAS domain S-box-containing protein
VTDMRFHFGKYEAEIRLGLVLVVVLLLVLNISTSYILVRVKDRLTNEVDSRLANGLAQAKYYLTKNQSTEIEPGQFSIIVQRAGIKHIGAAPVNRLDERSIVSGLTSIFNGKNLISELRKDDITRLTAGSTLFRPGGHGQRVGIRLVRVSPGQHLLVTASSDAGSIDMIGSAAQTALYLAAAVLVLIIPLVIRLPRQVLRPFREMRETARSAGRLPGTDTDDEVAEIIRSYEQAISELKKDEAELERLYRESSSKAHQLEKLNRYILKSIGLGLINVELSGHVIGYNRAAEEILGYGEGEVLGRHYLEAFGGEIEFCLLIQNGLERGEALCLRDIEITRRDGETRWLGVESSLLLDDQDRGVGITMLVTDLTEHKRLQSELEINRRLAALGEMTGGLAHQLRNSLAAISGFCQLLQKKTGAESDLGEIAGSIRTEAAASATMVSRFLTFSKPLSLTEEIIDIRRIINECLDKCLPAAGTKSAAITLRTAGDDGAILGDSLLLKEAFGNLIDNAVDAVAADGRVGILLDMSGAEVAISIADDGPGIPPAIRDKLFTPFVSSKPSGTGLGLALSHKIITLHHGSITLNPATPQGTVCRVSLPRRIPEREIAFQPITTASKNQ